MLKGFKDILTFILHFFSVLVQCFTSLAKAMSMTSKSEHRGPVKFIFIVIMPEYLFETKGFKVNGVNVIKKKCSISYTLGFGISACDITGSYPSPVTK